MKKIIKSITVLVILQGLLSPINVYGQQWKVHNEGRGFNKAWEAQQGDSKFGFIYGYNTSFINEDYCHSIYSKNHTAALSNGNGGHESRLVGGGVWAKIEVRHSGSSVWYGINY